MDYETRKSKWWLLISGIIFVVLGFYVWLNPEEALIALALYFGIMLIFAGVGYMMIFSAEGSPWHMALGLLNVFVGIIFIANLGVTAASLPFIFAFWSLFAGIIQISAAFHLKSLNVPWNRPLLSGILGILFAFLIISYPMIGAVSITILMGAYMIIYGTLEISEWHRVSKK